MLDQAEINSAVEKTIKEMQQTYPTPHFVLGLAYNMQEYRHRVGTDAMPLLIRMLLPDGWADWFLHFWMSKALEIYGVQACQEEYRSLHELLEGDRKSGLTGWRCPITEKQIALCDKFWFPRQATGGER